MELALTPRRPSKQLLPDEDGLSRALEAVFWQGLCLAREGQTVVADVIHGDVAFDNAPLDDWSSCAPTARRPTTSAWSWTT